MATVKVTDLEVLPAAGLPSAAEILDALRQAALIATKPTLRFPEEAMLYLGLGESATRRFISAHNIKLREFFPTPGSGASAAAFVRRSDLDRAQSLCRVKGRRSRAGRGTSTGAGLRQPGAGSPDGSAPDPSLPREEA